MIGIYGDGKLLRKERYMVIYYSLLCIVAVGCMQGMQAAPPAQQVSDRALHFNIYIVTLVHALH